VSQNAKQAAGGNYSYTIYDPLGRITEVGQKPQTTAMSQTISQDTTALQTWLAGGGSKEQITRTVYDVSYYAGEQPATLEPTLYQQNLRNRVSYSQIFDTEPSGTDPGKWAGTHTAATYYSYDIAGNVDTLLQDYRIGAMADAGNRFKKIAYNYDLISGKVNSVTYQPGQVDAFYHQYTYDADNRLTQVSTSNDSIYWENDAAYDYYRHGPLARIVLGQNQVQGIDYAYTLQGWLKGVNSTSVNDGTFDIGADGKAGSANVNVARDAYGLSLNYFNGDYKPIGNSATPFATTSIASDLFNGNIKSMALNIPVLGDALTFGYRYDQLNRLVKVDAYNGLNNTTNVWTPVNINDYKENLSYDPNGNIKTYLRNGTGSSLNLNNYNYTYTPNTNQLANIYNTVNSQTKTYNYDAIGNTTVDGMQGTTNGVWNVYGKLQSLTNKDGQTVTYTYSANGQRISKKVGSTEEWYVRDAAGNNLATYTKDATINSGNLTVTEKYKYGSSLLDVKDAKINVESPVANDGFTVFERGDDNYILADGNGNTKATISDKKIQHSTDGTTVDYYNADVRTATLHSSFGANAKTYNGGFAAANFNGQRKSLEIGADAQTAQFWEYNGDVGRRWNLDPKPTMGVSEYSGFLNNPIIGTDPVGDTITPAKGIAKAVFKRFDEVAKVDPYFKVLYNELKNSKGINVKIELNPKLSVGGIFIPNTSVLQYRDIDAIENDRSSTNEEMFHAYQTIFYGKNIMTANKGGSNLELEPRFLQAYKEFEANGSINLDQARFKYIPEIRGLVQTLPLYKSLPTLYKLTYIGVAAKFRNYWIKNNGPAKYEENPIFLGPDAAISIINKVHSEGEKSNLSEDSEMPIIIKLPKKKN
jgi:YD repeat-containing protein